MLALTFTDHIQRAYAVFYGKSPPEEDVYIRANHKRERPGSTAGPPEPRQE
jgi:hypothetical protein